MRWGKLVRVLAGTMGISLLTALAAAPAAARIVRLEVVKEEPAFGGRSFGSVGAYVRLTGRAHGEVDPNLPQNAIIQDIRLAPRNARGMVEYVTDIDILRPASRERGNNVLLFEVHNRGRKLMLRNLNDGVAGNQNALNAVTDAGDGFLMDQGYTIVWFGWQADIAAGEGRLTLSVPVAVNPDGSPVTGLVRAELTTATPTRTLNLSSGWFTGLTHTSYPTAAVDNGAAFADGFRPSLTVRARQQDPRVAIPNEAWRFGACDAAGAVSAGDRQICLLAGFEPGRLYELIYRARDPLVTGLGFAATRDLAAFLKHRDKDTTGAPNPVFRRGQKAIVMGTSQSGRMIRSFIHLGFNRDEQGRVAFEGALPHIGGGLMPLNVRFAQPGRAWGEQIDHLYPAYDFPFAYGRQHDPITGRSQGLLDRCRRDGTCPRIFHVATALEVWEGRQSLGLTDPMGLRDIADPANVRTYIMASTQHSPAPLPLPTALPFGVCQQQQNPNPHIWTLRALLTGLTEWVMLNRPPPASAVPRIADGTLVAPNQVTFPAIPANAYGSVQRPAVRMLRVTNPLFRLDYGPDYNAADTSGVITREPPRQGTADYAILVPQVDRDGNDVGGLRSVFLQAPIGTYTGWNLGRKDRFEDGFCSLAGSFVPFAHTRQERLETGDPRLSIEERYPTRDAYAAAVRAAADSLVAQRYLLPADAALLVRSAEADGIRAAP
jgi:Alpha/beta hydrolase domain